MNPNPSTCEPWYDADDVIAPDGKRDLTNAIGCAVSSPSTPLVQTPVAISERASGGHRDGLSRQRWTTETTYES